MKQAAESTPNDFHKWLINNRYSNRQFAELMREQLGVSHFSPRTVEKWRYGAIPHPRSIAAIKAITKGAITADSFMEPAR